MADDWGSGARGSAATFDQTSPIERLFREELLDSFDQALVLVRPLPVGSRAVLIELHFGFERLARQAVSHPQLAVLADLLNGEGQRDDGGDARETEARYLVDVQEEHQAYAAEHGEVLERTMGPFRLPRALVVPLQALPNPPLKVMADLGHWRAPARSVLVRHVTVVYPLPSKAASADALHLPPPLSVLGHKMGK